VNETPTGEGNKPLKRGREAAIRELRVGRAGARCPGTAVMPERDAATYRSKPSERTGGHPGPGTKAPDPGNRITHALKGQSQEGMRRRETGAILVVSSSEG
jgi:hypothetical protein